MKIRISGGLYASILALMNFATQYLFLPASLVERAGQEAWISALIGGLYGLAVALVVTWIASQFPDRDPLRAIRANVGRWAAAPIGLLYAALQLLLYSLSMRDVQDFTVVLLLPGTPGVLIAALLGGVALYAVWSGLEPIARIAYGTLLPWLLLMLILPVLIFREYRILQIDPLFWKGPLAVLQGAVPAMPWSGESIIVLSLLRHLSPKVNPYRWTAIGIGGGTLLLALAVALMTLVFGSVLPARQMYPGHDLLSVIVLTETIERVQAGIIVLWIGAASVKATLNLYAAAEDGALALGLQSHRGLAIGLAVAGVALAQIWSGSLQLVAVTGHPAWILGQVVTHWAILLLLLGTALLSRARRRGLLHG